MMIKYDDYARQYSIHNIQSSIGNQNLMLDCMAKNRL